jgi:hypothetical protein
MDAWGAWDVRAGMFGIIVYAGFGWEGTEPLPPSPPPLYNTSVVCKLEVTAPPTTYISTWPHVLCPQAADNTALHPAHCYPAT